MTLGLLAMHLIILPSASWVYFAIRFFYWHCWSFMLRFLLQSYKTLWPKLPSYLLTDRKGHKQVSTPPDSDSPTWFTHCPWGFQALSKKSQFTANTPKFRDRFCSYLWHAHRSETTGIGHFLLPVRFPVLGPLKTPKSTKTLPVLLLLQLEMPGLAACFTKRLITLYPFRQKFVPP